MMRILAIFIAVFVPVFAGLIWRLSLPVWADSASFGSAADSTLKSGAPNSNFGDDTVMDLNDARDGIIRFDLSTIPAGATVTSATLTLQAVSVGSGSAIKNYGVHRVLVDWQESTVTWNSPGSTADVHFAASPTSLTAVQGTGAYDWDVTSDVAAFVSGAAANYGWRIIWSSNTSGTNRQVSFGTKENGNPSNRPILTVIYTLPSPSPSLSPSSSPSPSEEPAAPSGGGGVVIPITTLTLSGQSCAGSVIEVRSPLTRDAFFFAVGKDGKFAFQVAVRKGEHFVSLRARDANGIYTGFLLFGSDVLTPPDYAVHDILFPPTFKLEREVVAADGELVLSGCAAANAAVEVEIDDIAVGEAVADGEGRWVWTAAAVQLGTGGHSLRARQRTTAGKESAFSFSKSFQISALSEPRPDIDGDGKITVRDLGLFLYRWGRGNKEVRPSVDVNRDERVDVGDFKLFMRLFLQSRK